MPPLVSIVTPSFNMGQFLDATIRSVLAQDYAPIEYLVLDGGSTDGTAEILKKYEGLVSISVAPDHGPSDCLRTGFGRARGEIFAWLSADDLLLPGAVAQAVAALQRHPEAVAVYGDAAWIDAAGASIRAYPTADFNADRLRHDCFICQPACFFRKSAYDGVGGIDRTLRYTFDWDLWIRMSALAPFVHIQRLWAESRMHAANITLGLRGKVLDESIRLLQRHARYVPVRWVYGWIAYQDQPSDQFFEVPRRSIWRYLRALAIGVRWNRGQIGRYAGEWWKGIRANRSSASRPDGG